MEIVHGVSFDYKLLHTRLDGWSSICVRLVRGCMPTPYYPDLTTGTAIGVLSMSLLYTRGFDYNDSRVRCNYGLRRKNL